MNSRGKRNDGSPGEKGDLVSPQQPLTEAGSAKVHPPDFRKPTSLPSWKGVRLHPTWALHLPSMSSLQPTCLLQTHMATKIPTPIRPSPSRP